MRKIICIILSLCLLIPLWGCSREQLRVPGRFYYRQTETKYDTDDGVIASEERELSGMETDLDALFYAYFSGPESAGLESPFPKETFVVNWELKDESLIITMNEAFAALTGVELTIACACISQTFLGLTDVQQVVIQAEDSLLDGAPRVVMSRENLLLKDNGLELLSTNLTIYYLDETARYLIGQEISVNLAQEDNIIDFLINQLASPTAGSGLSSALPKGTRLLSSTVADGLCTINLSAEFETNCWDSTSVQRLTLLAVVNTLTQLDEIDRVEFSTEGNLLAQYGGLTITESLIADESAIGPVRTALSEFDVTLYLSNGSDQYLAAVPTRIRQTASSSQAELVIQSLLNYQNINGFYSTIPAGTAVNFALVAEGICYVDLSPEFLSDTDHLIPSVYSIVASLCSLEEVQAVQITVDGMIPSLENYAHCFEILTPSDDWFL